MSDCSAVWVDASGGKFPSGAFVGGHHSTGEHIYVARAFHEGALTPGKLVPTHGCAFVPWGGNEHVKTEYQVLVGGPYKWVLANSSNIPNGAVIGGKTENGDILHIGRVNHERSITTGKVQPSHNVCYISYGGKELSFSVYEILTENKLGQNPCFSEIDSR